MTSVERAITVDVPVRTAYDQWTQFEDFPHFMGAVPASTLEPAPQVVAPAPSPTTDEVVQDSTYFDRPATVAPDDRDGPGATSRRA